ncbi:hypothetical protein [Sphingomonas sp.]|uniref:hypothetical protein n=1 Tax=Sphingomonas sp. TaxID=28214 RepID=UPI003AFFDC5F
MTAGRALRTPDSRYVVRGRLWRAANPSLAEPERRRLVAELGAARRAVAAARRAGEDEAGAHARVDAAKRGLGERGPVRWNDGAPDLNRHMAHTTNYADWHAEATAPKSGPSVTAGKEIAMPPRDKPEEPGADILPDTPTPASPGKPSKTESEHIEEEGEPFGDNFV